MNIHILRKTPALYPACLFLMLILFFSDSSAGKTSEDIIKENWIEIKTENFHIISNLEENRALGFAKEIEQFRFFFLQFSNIKMKKDIPAIRVYAFSNTSTYKTFNLPKDSVGIFLHRALGNFAVVNLSDYRSGSRKLSYAQQIMKHEYVHFAFDNADSNLAIPRWYNEGMAEYLSSLRMKDGYIHYGEINPTRLSAREHGRGIDIEALLKAERIPESRKKINNYYAHALALVHYCHFHPGMQEKLSQYLSMVGSGMSIDLAFSKAFEKNYKSLDKALTKYIKKGSFPFQRNKLKDMPPINVMEINSLRAGEISFYLTELIMTIGLDDEEQRLIAMSLLENSIASQENNLDLALLHLFRIHIHQKDLVAADAILDRMKDEISDYPGTYKAQADMYQLEMLELLKMNDPEWRDYFKLARKNYRLAISIDDKFLPAHMGLASIYANNLDGDLNVREGIAAFKKLTYYLSSPQIEYKYAELLLRFRRPAEARTLLTKVIAHTPDDELASKALKLKYEIFVEKP